MLFWSYWHLLSIRDVKILVRALIQYIQDLFFALSSPARCCADVLVVDCAVSSQIMPFRRVQKAELALLCFSITICTQ